MRWFEPTRRHHTPVAQRTEHQTTNLGVVRSNRAGGTPDQRKPSSRPERCTICPVGSADRVPLFRKRVSLVVLVGLTGHRSRGSGPPTPIAIAQRESVRSTSWFDTSTSALCAFGWLALPFHGDEAGSSSTRPTIAVSPKPGGAAAVNPSGAGSSPVSATMARVAQWIERQVRAEAASFAGSNPVTVSTAIHGEIEATMTCPAATDSHSIQAARRV